MLKQAAGIEYFNCINHLKSQINHKCNDRSWKHVSILYLLWEFSNQLLSCEVFQKISHSNNLFYQHEDSPLPSKVILSNIQLLSPKVPESSMCRLAPGFTKRGWCCSVVKWCLRRLDYRAWNSSPRTCMSSCTAHMGRSGYGTKRLYAEWFIQVRERSSYSNHYINPLCITVRWFPVNHSLLNRSHLPRHPPSESPKLIHNHLQHGRNTRINNRYHV